MSATLATFPNTSSSPVFEYKQTDANQVEHWGFVGAGQGTRFKVYEDNGVLKWQDQAGQGDPVNWEVRTTNTQATWGSGTISHTGGSGDEFELTGHDGHYLHFYSSSSPPSWQCWVEISLPSSGGPSGGNSGGGPSTPSAPTARKVSSNFW